MIVHVQTQIQTVFGVLDDDGNAIPQQPITVQVQRFAADAFAEAHAVIAQARDNAAEGMEPEPPVAENGGRKTRARPKR